jgi:hypothetical protein
LPGLSASAALSSPFGQNLVSKSLGLTPTLTLTWVSCRYV